MANEDEMGQTESTVGSKDATVDDAKITVAKQLGESKKGKGRDKGSVTYMGKNNPK